MNTAIQNQFSKNVAAAQDAKILDELAAELQRSLFAFPLPKPIEATGLIVQGDGTKFGLAVSAHGVNVKGHFDHVWLSNGQALKQLAGRFQFFVQNYEAHDVGDVLYSFVFDALGNTRLGNEKHFSHSIRSDAEDIERTCRKIALDLISAIHDGMDTIDRDVC